MYWSFSFNVEYCPSDKMYGPERFSGSNGGQLSFGFGALVFWLSWEARS